ncbi:MAG: hypothetical protein H6Q53_986 [Deltaproteobacteria bacterium]|nr:hypothetical protein [Deltaproteobacteria bacterium]
MSRKKIVFLMSLVLLIFGFSLPSLACDENHGSKIRVQAPIEAIDCEGTPPTVTLLGLQIDISAIKFEKPWAQVQCENPTCADFEVGQVVKVELASDITQNGFFTATELRPGGCHDGNVKITAPLQTIDLSGPSVIVLGLPVDISQATLVDDNEQPITADKLIAGQFVEMDLASPVSPLSATKVEAQSPISQVEIKLLGKKKRPVINVRDIRADVTVKGVKKALSIQNAGDGTLLVAGLPQGKAKIAVTCTQDGQMSKGSASVKVKTRKLQQITVRLKPVKY